MNLKQLIDLLQKINDFGTTLIVTTHNESIVNYLQKRVITLEKGKIISHQKTNGLYRLESDKALKKPGSKIMQPTSRKMPTAPISNPQRIVINEKSPEKPLRKTKEYQPSPKKNAVPIFINHSHVPQMKTAKKPTKRKVI